MGGGVAKSYNGITYSVIITFRCAFYRVMKYFIFNPPLLHVRNSESDWLVRQLTS